MRLSGLRKSRPSIEKPAAPSSDWFLKQFEEYVDPADNQIGPEGIEKMCNALGVDPSDVLVLVLAWLMEAKQMGYLTREEWNKGVPALGGATSNEALLDELRAVYASARKNSTQLRSLHRYTHTFCREDRRKNIDAAVAIPMVTLLHGPSFAAHVPKLCEFLEVRAPRRAPDVPPSRPRDPHPRPTLRPLSPPALRLSMHALRGLRSLTKKSRSGASQRTSGRCCSTFSPR